MSHVQTPAFVLISSERSSIVGAEKIGHHSYNLIREGIDCDIYHLRTVCPYFGIVTEKEIAFTYDHLAQAWRRSEHAPPLEEPAVELKRAA